jgi:DNA-binding NarL/FixJ family response regulator
VTKSVMIVASHASFRQDLATILPMLDPEYRVDASVACGSEVFNRLALAQPDLVLLDIDMANENGIEVLRQIHRAWPALAIIALGEGAAADYRQAILAAGGREYIDKLDLVATLPALLASLHTSFPLENRGLSLSPDPSWS